MLQQFIAGVLRGEDYFNKYLLVKSSADDVARKSIKRNPLNPKKILMCRYIYKKVALKIWYRVSRKVYNAANPSGFCESEKLIFIISFSVENIFHTEDSNSLPGKHRKEVHISR